MNPSNHYKYIYILVGGFNPSEKYEFVKWDYCSQYDGKVIKAMSQTTSQYVYI